MKMYSNDTQKFLNDLVTISFNDALFILFYIRDRGVSLELGLGGQITKHYK